MDRRRRDVIYTETMSIRLTPELMRILKEIAADDGMPPAMYARKALVDDMKRRKPGQFEQRHEGDDDA